MKLPTIISTIRSKTKLASILAWPFEFEICEPFLLANDWPISCSKELIAIAEDGSGGAYALLNTDNLNNSPVIFVSSEGQTGKVADSPDEFISLIIALPFWRDLLKFSASGDIEDMKRVAPLLANDILEDEPNIMEAGKLILNSLELDEHRDPIMYLHKNVASEHEVIIQAEDGSPYGSLFNSFSFEDYKKWNHPV